MAASSWSSSERHLKRELRKIYRREVALVLCLGDHKWPHKPFLPSLLPQTLPKRFPKAFRKDFNFQREKLDSNSRERELQASAAVAWEKHQTELGEREGRWALYLSFNLGSFRISAERKSPSLAADRDTQIVVWQNWCTSLNIRSFGSCKGEDTEPCSKIRETLEGKFLLIEREGEVVCCISEVRRGIQEALLLGGGVKAGRRLVWFLRAFDSSRTRVDLTLKRAGETYLMS